jgi:hypothetical protein
VLIKELQAMFLKAAAVGGSWCHSKDITDKINYDVGRKPGVNHINYFSVNLLILLCKLDCFVI